MELLFTPGTAGRTGRRVPAILAGLILTLAVALLAGLPAIAHAQPADPTIGPARGGLTIAATSEDAGAYRIAGLAEDCTAGDGVCLYENPGYGGRWVRFVGTGCYADFNQIPFNDLASSLRFSGAFAGGGFEAVLYEHTNYMGAWSAFRFDDPDLSNDAIGNRRASSICVNAVAPAPTCTGDGVYLYEHINYGGRCEKFTGSLDNLTAVNFNDMASSIRLVGSFSGGGTRATLFEHPGFTGASSAFTADDPDLRDNAVGNDRASSILIQPVSSGCPTITDWKGEYWNNTSLAGSPTMCRNDPTVNFNWGVGGPGGGIGSNFFSARWTRNLNFGAGRYRFTLAGDDGVRLWIDGALVIDEWRIQSRREFTVDRDLSAGTHSFRIEYFENEGEANVQFWWELLAGVTCPTITDWRGEYWNNMSLAGGPSLCRNDPSVNFNWGAGGPGSPIGVNNFSARWTRDLSFAAARYRFHVAADDGVRLWVDGVLLIDGWRDQARTEYVAERDLTAGVHSLRVEYYENTGDANVSLWWDQLSSTCPQYRAEYFNNMTLSGSPAYVACEVWPINHLWGAGGPGFGIGVNNFSARWTGRPNFAAGNYTFVARSDDGVRVWLDGAMIIDGWRDQAVTEYRATRTLAAGIHDIRVEYYENTGDAVAQFWWETTSTATGVVISNKPAFDACRLPLVSEMQEWWNASPYYEANLYLGGVSRACNDWNQSHLTTSWVQSVHAQGWNLIPTWVGLQAPCNTSGLAPMSWDTTTAFNQGRAEADAAANAAGAVGLTALGTGKTVIYLSIAPYPNNASCRTVVRNFMSGWVGRLHERGLNAGGYGASCASFVSDWATIANPPDNLWAATANWPRYDPSVTVWDMGGCVSNGLWTNHQRIFQYTLGHTEWWGNVGMTINSDIADGQVAGTHVRIAAGEVGAPAGAVGDDLLDAQLVTAEQGWALEADRLLWTNDLGATWADLTPSGAHSLRGATFRDAGHGWVALNGAAGLEVARTEDGGQTWVGAAVSPAPIEGDSGVGSVWLSFADAAHGWLSVQLATGSSESRAALFATADGGQTWQPAAAAPGGIPVAGPIRFVDAATGWVTGGPGGDELFVTRDGGQTWAREAGLPSGTPGAGAYFYGLPTFTSDAGAVLPVTVADEARPRVAFYRTADGGQSWQLAGKAGLAGLPAGPAQTAVTPEGALLAVDPAGGALRVAGADGYSRAADAGRLDHAAQVTFATRSTGWAIRRWGECVGAKDAPDRACSQRAELVRTVDGGMTWEVVER